MISHLKFNKQNLVYADYSFPDQELNTLTISHLNIFVGSSNSGKSRFLRELFRIMSKNNSLTSNYGPFFTSQEFSKLDVKIVCVPRSTIGRSLAPFVEALDKHLLKEKRFRLEKVVKENLSHLNEDHLLDLINGIEGELKEIAGYEFYTFESEIKSKSGRSYERYLDYWRTGTQMINEIKYFLELIYQEPSYHFTYLPPTRSLRRFQIKKKDLNREAKVDIHFYPYARTNFERLEDLVIRDKVFFDYFVDYSEHEKGGWFGREHDYREHVRKDQIFTGEELYDRVFELRNSVANVRQLLLDFEGFISNTFFNGTPVSINSLKKDGIQDVFIKIGDSPEFPVQYLGDGIQAIIILLFPIFEKGNQNHLVFIEEPELYLHPGYQRILIETLLKFQKAQVFLVSHSNHILELSQEYPSEVRLFHFQKETVNSKDIFHIDQFPEISIKILNSLGVRSSSVLLANCTIWVEGISDRLFYRRFLDIFMNENPLNYPNLKQFKEDIHFAFIEFSGSNISHWNFGAKSSSLKINASGISTKVFLIHDNDPGKSKRFELLNGQLTSNFHKLQCREVENLLSPEILKRTIETFRKLAQEPTVPFADFKYETYKDADIGEFICSVIDPNEFYKIVTKDNEKVARITDKLDFARRAVNNIKKWDQLTEEAQLLTIKLYQFIAQSNMHE